MSAVEPIVSTDQRDVAVIVRPVELSSSEALTALWALRHYRKFLQARDSADREDDDWCCEVLSDVESTIATIEGAK